MIVNEFRKIGFFTLLFALGIIISTSVASASPMPHNNELESLGSSQGSSMEANELVAEVHQVERNKAGNITAVTWSIENRGKERVVLTWLNDKSYTYAGQYFAGTTAMSSRLKTRYHPVMDGAGECLCSGHTANDFKERIEPGEKVTYWSLFSIPEDVEMITIEIPEFDPIEDIPIS